MRKFLTISFVALAIAIAVAVGVFLFLQYQLGSVSKETNVPLNPNPVTDNQPLQEELVTPVSSTTAPTGIPLKTLPLSEGQNNSLQQLGINPETFIITETMITCAEGEMGATRFDAIVAGAAPSFMEGLALVKCVK